MCFNRLELENKHVAYPIGIVFKYLLLTAFSQFLSRKPVAPNVLDWTFPNKART